MPELIVDGGTGFLVDDVDGAVLVLQADLHDRGQRTECRHELDVAARLHAVHAAAQNQPDGVVAGNSEQMPWVIDQRLRRDDCDGDKNENDAREEGRADSAPMPAEQLPGAPERS